MQPSDLCPHLQSRLPNARKHKRAAVDGSAGQALRSPARPVRWSTLPVGCVFCRAPIEMSSVRIGERHNRTASCSNCGLLVSVAAPLWALWSRTYATPEVHRGPAERLEAWTVLTPRTDPRKGDPTS